RDFHKAIRIRAVRRPNDQNEVDIFRHLLDRFLAILRRVANVVTRGSLYRWEFLTETRNDFLRVVEAEGRLRKERKLLRVFDFERVDGVHRIDDDRAIGSFAGRADDFLMVLVADQNNGALLTRKLEGFQVNLGNQRAGRVDDFEAAI